MRILVTGSSGHLGEALCHVLRSRGHDVIGLDLLESRHTQAVGSILDRTLVRRSLRGVDAVVHAATLHKPHVGTHTRQQFVDTNVTGTLVLLEEAVAAAVGRFVFTSTTSTFGHALTPPDGEPAAWITEAVVPVPRNIYGVTKTAAEDLCELVNRDHGLPCVVLRVSRFFPEADDRADLRTAYDDQNLKVNELLYRRVDLEDVVSAHRLALDRAPAIGFGRYIVSATTPFGRGDLALLRTDAPAVVRRLFPDQEAIYSERGWRMLPGIDRVYVNDRARAELGWTPRYDFRHALDRLKAGEDPRSPLALRVGAKGYHAGYASAMSDLASEHCREYPPGTPPLSPEEVAELRRQVPAWELDDGQALRREFGFDDFGGAFGLVARVSLLAEAESHHPEIELTWGRAAFRTWTHTASGLTRNDFIMAAKIDLLAEG